MCSCCTMNSLLRIVLILHYSWISLSVGTNGDCVNHFDVQKKGNSQMGSSEQMIVPQTYFFCSGRVKGFIVSLDLDNDNDNDAEFPHIQVWRNITSDLYTVVGHYQLQESDITRKNGYYLANVTLDGAKRIEFHSNDVIGYYHPSEPNYRVWNVENVEGYSIYSVNTHSSLSILSARQSSLNVVQDEQPLIQALYDIRCDNLSTPANGEIKLCSSGRIGVGYEGDTCSFTCNTGYELTGSDTRTCQSDGSWSGSDDVCRRVYCPLLGDPANGVVNCSLQNDRIPSFGDMCTFVCDLGYEMVGGNFSTCQSDGGWLSVDVVCIEDTESRSRKKVFNATIVAAIAGGIIATLILLFLLAICKLIFHRTKCTTISSKDEKPETQNHNEMVNLDTGVNLDINPSYHYINSSNDRGMSNQEYDYVVSKNDIVEVNSPYLDIIEETTRLHCENMAYVGSTK